MYNKSATNDNANVPVVVHYEYPLSSHLPIDVMNDREQ